MSEPQRSDAPCRRPGRPRSVEADEAILDATWALLAEVGYARMSMEGIAQRAGVGKPTLYLRYASKAEAVAAALTRLRMGRAPERHGELVADLVAQLEHLCAAMEGVGLALVGTCMAEEDHLPDLIELLRAQSLRPGRAVLQQILAEGVERGQIPKRADLDMAVTLLVGAFYSSHLAGERMDVPRVVRTVLRGLGARRVDPRPAD